MEGMKAECTKSIHCGKEGGYDKNDYRCIPCRYNSVASYKKQSGETKTYLYPTNMRSAKEGWGNFFVIAMEKGSKWLGYKDEEKSHRILINDESYDSFVKNAKENRKRFNEK